MPAPGEQHSSGGKITANPFEETKPRVSEYTAQEIATLQSRLEKQLGPEYISSRAGPSGQKVHYVAAEKCIQLANEVFGFNGWSSTIMNVQVDFVEENPTTFKVSLGLSVIVRVTLRDGTHHEDIGYGHIENCKGKAAAFEKAKKEGTTDGLKRALRNFGNVLGNCIYDKEYLAKVTKVKAQPTKWDVGNLHRHSDYAPAKKKEPAVHPVVKADDRQCELPLMINKESLDDEYGDFDDSDFSVPHDPDSHPDEVVLPGPAVASRHVEGSTTSNIPSSGNGQPMTAVAASNIPSVANGQPMPAPLRPQNSAQTAGTRIGAPSGRPAPQTPNSAFQRSNSGSNNGMQRGPVQNASMSNKPSNHAQNIPPRSLNQLSRTGPVSGPTSPQKTFPDPEEEDLLAPPTGPIGAGFFSAKAALPPGGAIVDPAVPLPPPALGNAPAFNPYAESPSIRRTPGVDHSKTKPTTRELKHVPGSTQQAQSTALPGPRGSLASPQIDGIRRIGAPGASSPLANRGSYKPPTMKRPSDGATIARAPLGDIPPNEAEVVADPNKRQRLSNGY